LRGGRIDGARDELRDVRHVGHRPIVRLGRDRHRHRADGAGERDHAIDRRRVRGPLDPKPARALEQIRRRRFEAADLPSSHRMAANEARRVGVRTGGGDNRLLDRTGVGHRCPLANRRQHRAQASHDSADRNGEDHQVRRLDERRSLARSDLGRVVEKGRRGAQNGRSVDGSQAARGASRAQRFDERAPDQPAADHRHLSERRRHRPKGSAFNREW
jgi:hypothetical protein